MQTISLIEWLAGILLGLALISVGVWLLQRLLRERRQKPDGSKWLPDLRLNTLAARGEGAKPLPTLADPFHRFPPGARIIVDVVFPGEYRIGWEYENMHQKGQYWKWVKTQKSNGVTILGIPG